MFRSGVVVPGNCLSVARQFLRCVLHQLAPNNVFPQIFMSCLGGLCFCRPVPQYLAVFWVSTFNVIRMWLWYVIRTIKLQCACMNYAFFADVQVCISQILYVFVWRFLFLFSSFYLLYVEVTFVWLNETLIIRRVQVVSSSSVRLCFSIISQKLVKFVSTGDNRLGFADIMISVGFCNFGLLRYSYCYCYWFLDLSVLVTVMFCYSYWSSLGVVLVHTRENYNNNNNNDRFTALCPGLLGWAGTRRNSHPPTLLIIIQSLSAFSIYHDP